jgi:CHAT domain-containing protein
MVIADPSGDLPSATLEGLAVAEALGSGTHVFRSSAATRERLWSARDADLLHLAVHVGARGRWRALRLADAEVDPSELVQHRLAPRIAVIAGCGSAAAVDEEGWGSIASALLESGTAVVIATDRSVADDDALRLMREFYAQRDWRADPARALARVQQALFAQDAATKLRSWAAFSVLARPPAIPSGSGSPAGRGTPGP